MPPPNRLIVLDLIIISGVKSHAGVKIAKNVKEYILQIEYYFVENMDDEVEVIDTLSQVINRQEAKILIFLKKHDSGTGSDMEHEMGMRQPEVSIATKGLLEKKLITSEEEKIQGNRGRPKLRFHLNEKKVKELMESILHDKKSTIDNIEKAVKKLF